MKHKIYIIAGENSGDFIGSRVIYNCKKLNHNLIIAGIGGPLMISHGVTSLFPMSEVNVMGFLEILPKIFKLKKLIDRTVEDIALFGPDVLVTIDSPGFTYRVAQRARAMLPGIKIIHIVAPSVWAYGRGRVIKYAKIYDRLLTLLPFEAAYFEAAGLACSYIGHPTSEQSFCVDKTALKRKMGATSITKTICVTQGSRKNEIAKHLPIFCQALNILYLKYHDINVIFVIAHSSDKEFIEKYLHNKAKFRFSISEDRLASFAASDVALAKSGTNTLEIAASGTPMVVAYKINLLSYYFIKMLIKVRYVSLINIISNREILPELIQFNCTPTKISNLLLDLLMNEDLGVRQAQASQAALKLLGFWNKKPPSEIAAEAILRSL